MNGQQQADLDTLLDVLKTLRAPLQTDEYDLHRLVMETLTAAGIPFEHEARLAPRCRVDLLCGGIAVEIKKGKPDRVKLTAQLSRYAESSRVKALIALTERNADLPAALCGKPLRSLCLNRLWGIAL